MTSPTLAYIHGKIDIRKYWAAVSAQLSFTEFCSGVLTWEEQLIEAVHAGFWRLDNLDRSSPFWNGTNRLATDSKLADFANFELSRNPKDTKAARLAIAMRLIEGSGHLEVKAWRALLEAGTIDYEFLFFSAFATAPYWSDSNIGSVSALIRSLNIYTEARAALLTLASRGQKEALWAEHVTREIYV